MFGFMVNIQLLLMYLNKKKELQILCSSFSFANLIESPDILLNNYELLNINLCKIAFDNIL